MSKFASFLAGMGSGYLKAQDKAYDRARQEKEDAWREEERNRTRQAWKESDDLKTAVKDAAAPRTTMQGTAVTDTTGNTNLYKDPMQAQAQAEEARIEAEMRGQDPKGVMTNQATGITGNMSKGHQITSGPVDLEKLNSRDAVVGRVTNALMEQGQVKDALSMENTALDTQAKRLGLESAQLKFADEKFNRELMNKLQAEGGDFWGNAAGVLSNTQLGALNGVQVKAVPSADGKKIDFVGVKDGKEQTIKSFDNSPEGQRQFLQQMMKASPEMKISWLKEQADAARTAEKDERDYGLKLAELEIKALTAKSQAELRAAQAEAAELRARILRGEGGGSGGSGGSGQVPGMNWEDRRKVLSDAAGLLPDPKSATSPEEATQIQTSNSQTLAKFDSVFSNNAQYGIALTAPQIQQALALAQDQRNVQTKVDETTGQAFKVVALNGRPVIVDIGVPAAPKPAEAPAAAAPAPSVPTRPEAPTTPERIARGGTGVIGNTGGGKATNPNQRGTPTVAPTAAPQKPMTLAEILVGPNTSSPALVQSAQAKAAQIESMASAIRAAQQKVVAASQSGQNPAQAMQEAAAAGAALNQALKDMNPQQASAVRKAIGM